MESGREGYVVYKFMLFLKESSVFASIESGGALETFCNAPTLDKSSNMLATLQ